MSEPTPIALLLPAVARSVAEIVREHTGEDAAVLLITIAPQLMSGQCLAGQLAFTSDRPIGDVQILRELLARLIDAVEHDPTFRLTHATIAGHA